MNKKHVKLLVLWQKITRQNCLKLVTKRGTWIWHRNQFRNTLFPLDFFYSFTHVFRGLETSRNMNTVFPKVLQLQLIFNKFADFVVIADLQFRNKMFRFFSTLSQYVLNYANIYLINTWYNFTNYIFPNQFVFEWKTFV